MLVAQDDTEQLGVIEELIARSSFLHLTNSRDYYPYSKGDGLPLIRIETPVCSAIIALQGAQLLEFQSAGSKQLLWLSPNCNFTAGTALRGGVPICLPWFGPHETDSTKPKHGFARNLDWALVDAHILDSGAIQIKFEFTHQPNELCENAFTAELTMTLGDTAKIKLNLINQSNKPFINSWALHSYFPVKSLQETSVIGVAGRDYFDTADKLTQKFQASEVVFNGEVDRVFPCIDNGLSIEGSPRIYISHYNCPSVIVWNPGTDNAAKITDIGSGVEQGFICVERGAVLGEKWNLAAGESQCAWIEIKELDA